MVSIRVALKSSHGWLPANSAETGATSPFEFYSVVSLLAMNDELLLFVEKAYKLETSPFWKWLSNRRGPSDIERIVAGDWLAHDGLTPEALDSFCLTLRLLIQDQDGFSIRKIAAIADAWPEDHASRREEIHRAVKSLFCEFKKLTNAGLFSYFVFQAFTDVLFHYRNCIQTIAFHLVQHLEAASSHADEGSQETLSN
jgi:hypothetical protein